MNYNLLSYSIYTILMVIIIYSIGKTCYTYGKAFILNAIQNEELTNRINKSLLAGYYLLNIGFVIFTIQGWPEIVSPLDIINKISIYVGSLLFALALLHYFNIYFITHLLKKIINH